VVQAGNAAIEGASIGLLSRAKRRELEDLVRRVVALAKVIAGACEGHRLWLLSVTSALYLVIAGLTAARKQLENDELFTLNIARLPSLAEVWSALLTGAEQLPPFFYMLTRAVLSLLGESNLALRLPAILGFWVMGLCLFRFVSKRSTALYGLAAMLFPLTTGAGSDANFSVTVQPGPTVAYEWSMNGVPIPGETSPTLHLNNVSVSKVGIYQVKVTETQSSRSTLSLPMDLQINFGGPGEPINADTRAVDKFLAAIDTTVRPNDPYDPAIVSGFTGTQIFTTYGSSGDPGEPEHCGVLCSFSKWHYYAFPTNSVVVVDNRGTTFGGVLAAYSGVQSAVTYATLVPIACSASHGAGNERVSFLAEAGVTYSILMAGTNLADIGGTVVLNHTETRPPFFTVLPISQTVSASHTLTLSVATSGYPPVGYQWQLNGVNIPNANGPSLSFSPFGLGNQGNYSVVYLRHKFEIEQADHYADLGLIVGYDDAFIAYLNGRLAATREQFIDYCVDMLLSRVSSY
jgi:hypothetical protein